MVRNLHKRPQTVIPQWCTFVIIWPMFENSLYTNASELEIKRKIHSNCLIFGKAVSITVSFKKSSKDSGLFTFSVIIESVSPSSLKHFPVLCLWVFTNSNFNFKDFSFPVYSWDKAIFCWETFLDRVWFFFFFFFQKCVSFSNQNNQIIDLKC